MEPSKEILEKNTERLRKVALQGGDNWRDKFDSVIRSIPTAQLEDTLVLFIEDVIKNPSYKFETFVEIYEITSEIWKTGDIYLPWIELVSKYGTDAMFQIMDEDVNESDLWYPLLVLNQAYEIGMERVALVIKWMEDGGHDLDEVLDDYIYQLNDSMINENNYDIPVILALCTHLKIDITTQAWATDGRRVSERLHFEEQV